MQAVFKYPKEHFLKIKCFKIKNKNDFSEFFELRKNLPENF